MLFEGDFASSQIGVVFLVIYMSIVITMLFGLPAVLMQRVMTSTLTGRVPASSELEVLCLLLVIITAVSVFMTMKAIIGSTRRRDSCGGGSRVRHLLLP